MLQVGVVHQSPAPLVLFKFPVKIHGQLQQGFHSRGRLPHLPQQLFRWGIKQLLQALHGLFTGLPPALQPLRQSRVGGISQAFEPVKAHGQATSGAVPACVQAASQLPYVLSRMRKAVHISGAYLLILGHESYEPIHFPGPIGGHPPGFSQYFPSPRSLRHILNQSFQRLHLCPCPVFRSGMALHAAMESQHQLRQTFVGASGSHSVRQAEKSGVAVGVTIASFQHPLKSRLFHTVGAFLIHYFKVRAQAQQMAIFPQQGSTEAVDGAYLGPGTQGVLTAQPPVPRLLGQLFRQLLHYPAPQLSGGSPGKGDYQEAVQIYRVPLVANTAHKPLSKHSGLAAARPGRHQQGTAPGFDGCGLGRRRIKSLHLFPLLPAVPRLFLRRALACTGSSPRSGPGQNGRPRSSHS